ncbi:unnamed protein product [Clonostachys rhizophaga]|uniref:Uncharacterized protein n=1 Tax=Clonostachys rhizophaga TaxID=160324 RepID=A0A9N9VAP0_9HYPO|nr:unnamed protein product [Clonostachys rhizophaga]
MGSSRRASRASRASSTPSRDVARGRSRYFGFRDFLDYADYWLTNSRLGRLFKLEGTGKVKENNLPSAFSYISAAVNQSNPEKSRSTFFREIRAGLTTFATMAYIIAVNVSSGLESPLYLLSSESDDS